MCNCNESPFNKLRESWSRHCRKEIQLEYDCECQNSKPRVKGKFGVAYVIETPTRKCKPCGWEVEFDDTPSQIENNCKKMMNWITCPPLGECRNNNTNVCVCSNVPKSVQSPTEQICCESVNRKICYCCNDKDQAGRDNCYHKNTQKLCCRNREINKNQCCLKINQIQCCSQPKESICCSAMNGKKAYLKSKHKCRYCQPHSCEKTCCCIYQYNDNNEFCGPKTAKTAKYCCQCDSQSSLEDCECQKPVDKNPKEKECDCNCFTCKCSKNTKHQTQYKKIHENEGSVVKQKRSKERMDSHHHTRSKNLLSPEPKTEKEKGIQRSPYTISGNEAPKKDPDKNEFHYELSQRLRSIKQNNAADVKSNIEKNRREIANDERQIQNTEYENEHFKENQPSEIAINNVSGKLEEGQKAQYQQDERQISDDNQTSLLMSDSIIPIQPPRKKFKGAALLKKIKQEHRKEIEAIHPKPAKQE